MYSLKHSNQVIYEISDSWYMLCDKSDGNTGNVYFDVFLNNDTWREPKLIGVTPEYLIFSIKKHNDALEEEREKIVVEINETMGNYNDRIFHKCIKYSELTLSQIGMMHEVENVEEIKNEFREE